MTEEERSELIEFLVWLIESALARCDDMTVMIQTNWHQIGVLSDGTPLKACGVFDDDKVLGRVVDLGGGYYRADFVNGYGDPQEIVMPDYPTAVTRVVDEAKIRKRMMN